MGNGESESTPKKHYWGKRIIISLVIIIGIVFAWHFYLSFDLSKRLESLNMHAIEQNSGLFVSTNYFTNHVNKPLNCLRMKVNFLLKKFHLWLIQCMEHSPRD